MFCKILFEVQTLIKIAHRGNIKGPNKKLENNPEYVLKAIAAGYEAEIDVWYVDGHFFLGHDDPVYIVEPSFLLNKKFWCHAKNIQALEQLIKLEAHCFWHEEDDCTLTSKGFIWTYPGKELTETSVCVMPSDNSYKFANCYGVCSDYIEDI